MSAISTNQISSVKSALYTMVNNAGKRQANQQSSVQAANVDSKSTRADMTAISKEINRKMEHIGADINFSYNDDINGLVVTVKDPEGGRVIREIPTKEAILLTKRMNEALGVIFDKKG